MLKSHHVVQYSGHGLAYSLRVAVRYRYRNLLVAALNDSDVAALEVHDTVVDAPKAGTGIERRVLNAKLAHVLDYVIRTILGPG